MIVKRCPKCGSSNVGRICSKDSACREKGCRYRGPTSEFLVEEDEEVTEDEIDELTEDAIRRKKKGRRYGGKYKGRGKFKEEKW